MYLAKSNFPVNTSTDQTQVIDKVTNLGNCKNAALKSELERVKNELEKSETKRQFKEIKLKKIMKLKQLKLHWKT